MRIGEEMTVGRKYRVFFLSTAEDLNKLTLCSLLVRKRADVKFMAAKILMLLLRFDEHAILKLSNTNMMFNPPECSR